MDNARELAKRFAEGDDSVLEQLYSGLFKLQGSPLICRIHTTRVCSI